jgi:eukaryotic-like serine/threonine-protein kinase
MISVSCSSCQKKLSVKDTLAGKKIKCPGCGQVIPVPAPVPAAGPSVSADDRTLPPEPTAVPGGKEPSAVKPSQRSTPSSYSSRLDVTVDGKAPTSGHDPSLTDFLAPARADDELGRLGKYRILKILGFGGMGVVYKAEDPLLKRTVALKAMLPTLAASASAGKRFLLEAQSMAAVEHDHVVRVLEVAEERGVPFLAMEFLKGEPLDGRLERDKTLPIPEVMRIGKEIAEGLQAAHEQGLIHRDIKPGNIWLEAPKGRVKILDFGLARSAQQESGLTQQGAIIGTPAFMAPEQGRGDAGDGRSDLFSLGVILYRLCCGKQAFQGKDTVSTLMAVATHEPPPPIRANPELPPELSDLVMQLLQKGPDRRPKSATVVVEMLQGLETKLRRAQEVKETVSLPPPAREKASPAKEKAAPAKRGRLPLLVGSLLLLAGLIGAGLWAAGFFRFQTEQGDLVLQTDDDDFAFVPVKGGGLTLEDRKNKKIYHLKAVPQGKDEYDLEVTDAGADAELSFKTKTFTVKRAGKVALRAWFERKGAAPPVAVQPPPDVPATGTDDAWIKEIAKLPAEKQVEAVVAKLVERNPDFDPKKELGPKQPGSQHEIKGGVVSGLSLGQGKGLKDLSPLRALPWLRELRVNYSKLTDLSPLTDLGPLKGLKLTSLVINRAAVNDLTPLQGMPLTLLSCDYSPVKDLSPLKGMPLTDLSFRYTQVNDLSPLKDMQLKHLNCAGTKVTDLSPLAGIPLTRLTCNHTAVTDLSPLKGMPLGRLVCDFQPRRDAEILRSIKTLEIINLKPAAEFWKEVDASAPDRKP